MEAKLFKSEIEYKAVLQRIREPWESPVDTPEADEDEILTIPDTELSNLLSIEFSLAVNY